MLAMKFLSKRNSSIAVRSSSRRMKFKSFDFQRLELLVLPASVPTRDVEQAPLRLVESAAVG